MTTNDNVRWEIRNATYWAEQSRQMAELLLASGGHGRAAQLETIARMLVKQAQTIVELNDRLANHQKETAERYAGWTRPVFVPVAHAEPIKGDM